MGNFEDHIQYGVYAFVLTLIICFTLAYAFKLPYQLTVAVLPIAFSATLFGSILPDIDHHNSHPHKTLKLLVPAVTSSGVLITFNLYFTQIHQTLTSITPQIHAPITGFIGFIIAISVFFTLRKLITIFRPPHRGITHSHLFNITISGLFYCLFTVVFSAFGIQAIFVYSTALILTLAFTVGFASHQYCDDMLL